jgi:hypothetical protein
MIIEVPGYKKDQEFQRFSEHCRSGSLSIERQLGGTIRRKKAP